MKRREYTYTDREIVEIIRLAKALVASLRLPGFEGEAALAPAVAEDRAYRAVGTRTPTRSQGDRFCPDCHDELRLSKYPDKDGVYRPYCHSCWAANKDRR